MLCMFQTDYISDTHRVVERQWCRALSSEMENFIS